MLIFLTRTEGQQSSFRRVRFTARIHYHCQRKVVNPIFTFAIFTSEKAVLVSNYSNFDGYNIDAIEGEGYIDFVIERMPFRQSTYFVSVALKDNGDISSQLDWHEQRYSFVIMPNGPISYGLVNPSPIWKLH